MLDFWIMSSHEWLQFPLIKKSLYLTWSSKWSMCCLMNFSLSIINTIKSSQQTRRLEISNLQSNSKMCFTIKWIFIMLLFSTGYGFQTTMKNQTLYKTLQEVYKQIRWDIASCMRCTTTCSYWWTIRSQSWSPTLSYTHVTLSPRAHCILKYCSRNSSCRGTTAFWGSQLSPWSLLGWPVSPTAAWKILKWTMKVVYCSIISNLKMKQPPIVWSSPLLQVPTLTWKTYRLLPVPTIQNQSDMFQQRCTMIMN